MTSSRLFPCVLAALLAAPIACKDSGEKGKGKEADAAAKAEVSLDKLGLKGEAPSGAKVKDAIVGEGLMVEAPGLVVTVSEASDSRPKTLEEAKKQAQDYSPSNIKEEKLGDGFVLSYENKGGMGTNYFVNARRELGGKSYWCETTASQPEQQQNAIAFCKSLKG